jgi:N-carbamoyl-L-amino-acid hydrolase
MSLAPVTATGPPAKAVRVDAETLWSDLMALAAITDRDRPYTRRSFSALFLEGRAWLTQRMQDAGLTTHIDAAGNLIGRLAGTATAQTIVIGSHSDSVPSGGRFDGMAGVIAGLAIARALAGHRIALRHSLEIVDFLAEEPSEFGLSCIGSRGITGNLSAADLALTNTQEETLADALVRMGGRPAELQTARRTDLRAAFELHIEQGPVLEADGLDIGVVTAIVGITRIELQFLGTAGHAGTTPMRQRRDPLLAAAHLVGWVRRSAEAFAERGHGHFVATVGVIEALPGATNVIPKSARIVVDARGEDPRLTEEFRRALDAESLAAAAAAHVERIAFTVQSSTKPAVCDPALQRLLSAGADALGYSSKPMASGAGHDMAFLAHVAPMAMVFIPCKDGRSHTPDEWATATAVQRGTDVMLAALLQVDLSTDGRNLQLGRAACTEEDLT